MPTRQTRGLVRLGVDGLGEEVWLVDNPAEVLRPYDEALARWDGAELWDDPGAGQEAARRLRRRRAQAGVRGTSRARRQRRPRPPGRGLAGLRDQRVRQGHGRRGAGAGRGVVGGGMILPARPPTSRGTSEAATALIPSAPRGTVPSTGPPRAASRDGTRTSGESGRLGQGAGPDAPAPALRGAFTRRPGQRPVAALRPLGLSVARLSLRLATTVSRSRLGEPKAHRCTKDDQHGAARVKGHEALNLWDGSQHRTTAEEGPQRPQRAPALKQEGRDRRSLLGGQVR